MAPPPPIKNYAQLCMTTHGYAQLSTMVDFIVLSIKFVFMVLGISYSRVVAQLVIIIIGCVKCNIHRVLYVVVQDMLSREKL